jgi:hypothetical protein
LLLLPIMMPENGSHVYFVVSLMRMGKANEDAGHREGKILRY